MLNNQIEMFYFDSKFTALTFEISKHERIDTLKLFPCVNFTVGNNVTSYSLPIETKKVKDLNQRIYEQNDRDFDAVMPERSFKVIMVHTGHIKLMDNNGTITQQTTDNKLITLGEGELIYNHKNKTTELHIYKNN